MDASMDASMDVSTDASTDASNLDSKFWRFVEVFQRTKKVKITKIEIVHSIKLSEKSGSDHRLQTVRDRNEKNGEGIE